MITFKISHCLAIALAAALLVRPGHIHGQARTGFESLSIDRPDVSNLPTTVRPGHFQFELGYERALNKEATESHLPNIMFRTGLAQRVEVRIGYDQFLQDSVGAGPNDNVRVVSIGVKYRFIEERGARPAIALQAEYALPFGTGIDFDNSDANFAMAACSFLLLFNNTLHEQVFINYNAGIYWSKADHLDYLVSSSFSFLHTHRLGYFLELYTLVLKDRFPISFDAGLMYLVSPRFQLDLYGGRRAMIADRAWFYGAGVGFRLDKGDLQPRRFTDIGIHH